MKIVHSLVYECSFPQDKITAKQKTKHSLSKVLINIFYLGRKTQIIKFKKQHPNKSSENVGDVLTKTSDGYMLSSILQTSDLIISLIVELSQNGQFENNFLLCGKIKACNRLGWGWFALYSSLTIEMKNTNYLKTIFAIDSTQLKVNKKYIIKYRV